jgi:hypothetical protein
MIFYVQIVGKLAKSSLLHQMKKLNAYPAAAEMLKKCFQHLHLYPEKQAAECPAREIPPAAVLHQAMQIAPDQAVVAAKYRETFEKRPLSKSALICPISVSPMSGICQRAQIVILEILNIFLRLKFSPSLNLNKIGHFSKVSPS